MQLGRLGAWYSTDKLGGAKAIAAFAANVERLGYGTLWYPESRGYESFSVAGFMLGATKTLNIGSSIASIYARDAFTSRRGMISLNALYGDRFILGLGVSHLPMVEGVRGHTYGKPIPVMRAYLDGISKDQPGAEDWPLAVAALGPLMLKLAGEKTRGALPYNVTPEHTARAAKIMGSSRRSAWRPILRRPERLGVPSCRATWCWTIIEIAGWAWALPRRSWRAAGPTGSSTRWCFGGMPRR